MIFFLSETSENSRSIFLALWCGSLPHEIKVWFIPLFFFFHSHCVFLQHCTTQSQVVSHGHLVIFFSKWNYWLTQTGTQASQSVENSRAHALINTSFLTPVTLSHGCTQLSLNWAEIKGIQSVPVRPAGHASSRVIAAIIRSLWRSGALLHPESSLHTLSIMTYEWNPQDRTSPLSVKHEWGFTCELWGAKFELEGGRYTD